MNNTQRIGSSILRLTTALLLAVVTTASAQTFTLLHTFTGSDGAYPVGSLIVSNATLYGMTSSRVCKMNTNGSSCSNLHSFGGFAGNADNPHAALTLSGTNLYGMTVEGGAGVGVAFRVSTNGIGYTNLHSFAGGTGDGATPLGSLTLANGRLYGMTSVGGASNKGVVFRVNTDGSSYTNVHSFAGGTNDGATAYGSLMLDGSTLYGMTYYGGATNKGVVFALSNIPPAPPPSLTIVYANKQAIVSWPSSVSGWTLQTNNNPATGTWSNYTGPIISNTVTNSPTKGNLFFRLRHP
jgi:uncharacterized repeat protein (TIGR03803 family)